MRRQWGLITVVVTAGCAVGLVAAQQGSNSGLPLDSEFLTKAFVAGHKEVQLSKLAERQSRSAPVKELAQQMIQDHSKANEQIAELMKANKVAVVAGTEKDAREAADKLGKLEGPAFDRAYVETMVKDHRQAVSLFENEAKLGKNADIVKFARDTLPTIRGHLKHAQTLASGGPK